ncbi:MAG: tandem-95 repeat protein [Ramlibacter sp.]
MVNAALGTVLYTPNANFHGTDTYTYTVTSGGVTETATVTVTVNPVDDPVTFGGATSGSGNEDTAITGTLTAADTADGMTTPAFTVVGAAANGTATINASTGAWSYTPNADYNGADSFTVRVTDNLGNTATQVITLAVAAQADSVADSAATGADVPVTIDVLGTDNFEGTPTIVAINGAAITDGGAAVAVTNGSVALSGGSLVFTPAAGFSGTPAFTYTVSSGGVTETATVTVTVVATPTVSAVSDPSVTEGTALVYGVTLSHGSPVATTHAYSIGGGGSTAVGADYGTVSFTNGVTLSGGVLTVPANVTSFDVVVAGQQDLLDEAAETLQVSVGGVVGTGTLADDDATPSLSIDSVVVDESAGTATFTVTLDAASGQTVTVGYATANGSAGAGDYTGASGTLTFAPGVVTQTIVVAITEDTIHEAGGEGFTVGLSGATNATIATGSGTGTITDNDAVPVVATISSPTVTEGSDLTYTITLSNASSGTTTIGFSLGGTATALADYALTPTFSNGVTLVGGNLVVPAGVTSFTATLPTLGDLLDEADETVVVTSANGVVGTGTILDDDATPTLSINDRSVDEAAGTMTFTVTLNAASGQTVTVDFATANGTAAAPGDYTGASGTLTFAPGVLTQTVTIAIADDTTTEAGETFDVVLSSPVNATIADGTGVGTIADNDQPPAIDLDADDSSGATGSGHAASFTENGAAVAVADADIALTDPDSANLAGATITLTNAQAGDLLAAGSMPAGIVASVAGNVVTLSGSATLADYQAAIRAVTFSNASESPVGGARTIEVVVSDGTSSSATATTTITVVPVNDAPVNAVPGAQATTEDAARVFSVANGNAITVGDVDSTTLTTVVSVTNGTLAAVTGGGATITSNGTAAVTISGTAAQIAAALDGLSFTPAANYNGSATLTVQTSDGSLSDSDAVTITVSAVNDAPVLADTVLTLAPVNEDAPAPSGAVGTLVSALVGGSTDVDAGAVKGIAITAADAANGTWYYSTNAGTTWTAVGVVANNSALLLASDASTRVYFQPNANYNGTVATGLTVRAWDTTSGTAGSKVDTSTNGGTTAFSSATDTVSIVVNPVNDAPVLADTVLTLAAVNEDAAVPSGVTGTLVSTLVGGSTDVDAGAVKGIAITGADATNGTWYYSTNAGTTWTAMGAVANNSALLLASDASTRVYFQPNANYNGTVGTALTIRGWDTTSGTAGTKVDTSSNGGTTAFSSATDTVSIVVNPVNDAPVLADTVLTLAAVNEDAAAPSGAVGSLVSTLVGGSTDIDAGAVKGIAITAADAANGTWYYSTNAGTTWTAVGVVANNSALLLASDASTRVYFQPNANYNGTVGTALTIRGWDTTSGTAGTKVDTGTNGGTTAFSSATDTVSIVVNPVNDAPVLADTVLTVAAVNEDAAAPAGAVGTLVSTLVGGSTDVDAGAVKGIAITGADATNGTWYYSTNGGTTWTALGAVANTSALLLASDANSRVYFQPNANYNGTVTNGLTVRGWDTTTGTAGTKVSTATNGGTTAFSSATDTVAVTVNPVNDAPVLADTVLALAAINEDPGAPSGAVGSLVSTLVGGSTDIDAGAVKGIAITATDTTNGTWFYSTNNGSTWTAVGAVANNSALLLAADANTRVYFQPNLNYNGTVATALTIRAWDTTSGTAGTKVSTATNGGTTAFSTATDTVSIVVNAVNDAPVGTTDSYSATEGATVSLGNVLANDTDVESQPLTALQVATTSAGAVVPVNGTNAVTTALGGTVVMNTDGTFTYTAPPRIHNDATPDVDSFVYRASDGSASSGWVTVNITITDSAPVATADQDTVARNSSTTGNVITGTGGPTADYQGAEATGATISGISWNAVAVTPSGGTWTVNTGTGTLTIAANGSYTYTSSAPAVFSTGAPTSLANWTGNIVSHGFDGEEPYNSGATATSGLNLANLTAARAGEVRFRNNGGTDDDGIGVETTAGNSGNNRIENGEDLVLNLGRLSQSTSVTLTDLSGGETAQWHVYAANGAYIDSGTIGGNGSNIATGLITASTPFQYVVLTSGGSTYRINGMDVTPYVAPVTVDYTLTDADGSTSTSTLTVSTVSSVTLQGDTAVLSEAGLATGTAPVPGGPTVSGNVLNNDVGITSTGAIDRVTVGATNFFADGNGVITATDANGTLVLYTQAYNGRLAGDYTYTLNAATVDGSTDTRNFTYRVTDGAATYTAGLAINVTDDAPSATSAVAEVAELPASSYNLVLMLDISASMYANNAGGEVRSVDANGNAVETTRLAMAKTGLIALVEEYFSQAASVSVKLGLFASGATMLNGGAAYTSKAALIAAINGITGTELTSSTDYDAGINAMRTAFGTPSSSVTNVSYFLSDGAPTNAANANAAIATYNTFAANNNIKSYAVGIGTGIADVSYLNNLHNVDGDVSGGADSAVIVPDLNKLDETLISTVPSAYTGSVGGTGGASNVTFGADGGYIRYIEVVLDSNADTVPDQTVRFTYDPGTGQITQNSSFLTGYPLTASAVNLGSASGFVHGTLVFDFTTGEYTYFTATSVVEGDEFTIGFQVMDGDGDTAIASQTIRVVDGKPVARDDFDTLMPGQTVFEGNVINGVGTDGGTTDLITEFTSSSVSKDTILDGAVITSVRFKNVTFDLTTNASGNVAGGNWSVANGKLTWTSTTEPANVLVFDEEGYYRYTPPAAQTAAPTVDPAVTTFFNSAANADDNGITLSGFSRLANLTGTPTYAHAALSYTDAAGTADDGVGVPAGETAGTVDDLETLVITFNPADHAYGVRNVSLTINTNNSNLSPAVTVNRAADGGGYGNVVTTVTYTVYDISGNLLGQFSSFAEGPIAIPAEYANIGRIEIEANSAAQARVQNITFQHISGGGTAATVAPESLGYTLTDANGDQSSADLLLGVITNHISGTAAGEGRTGTTANDYISGQGGNDTLSGGAGYDLIRGDAGDDSIDGGADADRLFGGVGADTIAGGTGNDEINGEDGADVLNGGDGDDIVRGGAGDDLVNGGLGADTLLGGAGNDTIDSGNDLVSDVFQWELADTGSKGAPAIDTITNFDAAVSGGDVLDLRDLLVGENQLSTNLDDYLHFEKSGTNTIVHISASGEFAAGYSAAREVQTIVLQGVDLIGTMNTDQQIIQDLLTKGKLLTD